MMGAGFTMATMPVVTALYGSLNALLNITLAALVSRARGKHGVSIGEGSSKPLQIAMRTHGNNAEFVPLAIVMMLLAELCGASSLGLHVSGGVLLVSRILHAVGMPRPAPNAFRLGGTAGTWLVIIGLAVWTLLLRRNA